MIDVTIEAEGIRREMLDGRGIEDALLHASAIIANQREHMQRCGERMDRVERERDHARNKLARAGL